MGYYGYQPATGDNNNFKVLDDISSYTLTFDGSSAGVVSVANDTLTFNDHRFVAGQRVTYGKGSGGTVITGLTDATVYFVIREDKNTIKLATSAANATLGTAVNLTGVGAGTVHTLNLAFDGVNTKFKATYENGSMGKISRAGQLSISINGVLQQPTNNNVPTSGFGIDTDSVIILSTAPASSDTFWGQCFASNTVTFDITDNVVDTYTGDGSKTQFALSKDPLNNENILVTIDGVVQYPSTGTTSRAYTLNTNILTFTAAPGNNTDIQIRHIGFAAGNATGGGSGGVTGFYGRTGNVSLISTDNILGNDAVISNNLSVAGITTAGRFVGAVNMTSGSIVATAATFSGNVSIGGTLTYEDVKNVDSVGIITARTGLRVTAGGVVVTAGDISIGGGSTVGPISGIVTYYGDGSELTGVVGGKFRGYTAGIGTEQSVGINTTNLDDNDLTGIGNSFKGLYVANGMVIHDNFLEGNHYIGTSFNGLMAGPVTINGVLTVDGNYVVV